MSQQLPFEGQMISVKLSSKEWEEFITCRDYLNRIRRYNGNASISEVIRWCLQCGVTMSRCIVIPDEEEKAEVVSKKS